MMVTLWTIILHYSSTMISSGFGRYKSDKNANIILLLGKNVDLDTFVSIIAEQVITSEQCCVLTSGGYMNYYLNHQHGWVCD